jgi:hypothetical protein
MMLDELLFEKAKQLAGDQAGLGAVSFALHKPELTQLPLFDSLSPEEAAQLLEGDVGTSTSTCSSSTTASSSEPALDVEIGTAGGTGSQQSKEVSSSTRRRGGFCYPGRERQKEGGVHWKLFDSGSVFGREGEPVSHIAVVGVGTVLIQYGAGGGHTPRHTVVASVGDPIGVYEALTGKPLSSSWVADTMVQALLLPVATFHQLLRDKPAVAQRAWQAAAAQLAGQHHHILGVHKQLAPLNLFLR